MPERPRRVHGPADTVGPATPIVETTNSKADQNTPEEDALEKAARAVVRNSEAAQQASAKADEQAEFAHLLAERWKSL